MSHHALVTVVIPNYNHGLYLKERIESVINQSFQNFELYILDDCSTDDSIKVMSQFESHPKVKGILKNKTNSGSLFKQWVKAIELAKGSYLWIAESDDYAHVDFLKDTVAVAEKYKDLGLVFSDSMIVNQSGEFIEKASATNKGLTHFKDTAFSELIDKNKVPEYFVSDLIIWNASSVLFSTNALKHIDFELLQRLKNAGDLFSYISISMNYDIAYVNKPLNYFRRHGDNTTEKNAVSGALHNDRLIIINHFIHDLVNMPNAKVHLKSFLSRNFLTAVDFKFYGDVKTLLKAYHKFKILPFGVFLTLSFYVCYSRLVSSKYPFAFRQYIKKVLSK